MYSEYSWKYQTPKQPQNASWEQEIFKTLYTLCLFARNTFNVKKGDYVRLEADAATITALQSLDNFNVITEKEDSLTGTNIVGTLENFEIHRNILADNNYILLSYNGKVAKIIISGLSESSLK